MVVLDNAMTWTSSWTCGRRIAVAVRARRAPVRTNWIRSTGLGDPGRGSCCSGACASSEGAAPRVDGSASQPATSATWRAAAFRAVAASGGKR